MRFVLVDRIFDSEPGKRLKAAKNLSLAEEYLADHFPGFPVMPGVLMLEALAQAGAWLIRETEDFAHSVIVLKQARTVKYGSFVEPGRTLELHVDLLEMGPQDAVLKGKGVIEGQVMVQCKLTLTRRNLRDQDPALASMDESITASYRELHAILRRGRGIGDAAARG